VPWIDGKHVSVGEWRALNPLGPTYRYGSDGERWHSRETMIDDEDEAAQPDRMAEAIRWSVAENARRAGLTITERPISRFLTGMGAGDDQVGPVGPNDWPGWEASPTTEDVRLSGGHRRPIRDAGRIAAIADAMGMRPDDERMADVIGDVLAVPVDHERVDVPEPRRNPATPDEVAERLYDPREHAANRHSASLGLPTHRKDRPSQTPKGRRARYLRQVAERDGITLAAAAQLHPPRKPKDDPS
jgi:hypothetical protein